MKAIWSLLLASADVQFHEWCSSVGIQSPSVSLRTTEESVAGRGVFADKDFKEGDVAIQIPESVVLHGFNGAANFPDVAETLSKKRRKASGGKRRLLRRLFGRKNSFDENEFVDSSDYWQAELTAYALASLEATNHPWAPWISQWQRSDPIQNLFENGVSWRDEDAVMACAEELKQMMPSVSIYKAKAAIDLRLRRMEGLQRIFGMDEAAVSMCGILISRAIDLGQGITGVVPMFDMVNHSHTPNLALSFNGESFELWATREIKNGEELFLCYNDEDELDNWDEYNALWNLVQWGIPQLETRKIPTHERMRQEERVLEEQY